MYINFETQIICDLVWDSHSAVPFFMLIFYNCATACGTIAVFVDPIEQVTIFSLVIDNDEKRYVFNKIVVNLVLDN